MVLLYNQLLHKLNRPTKLEIKAYLPHRKKQKRIIMPLRKPQWKCGVFKSGVKMVKKIVIGQNYVIFIQGSNHFNVKVIFYVLKYSYDNQEVRRFQRMRT